MKSDDEMKQRIGEEVSKHTAKKIGKIVAMVVGGVFMVLVFGVVVGWIIQWLWNNTLVVMFDDFPTITYWQAVGVFILAKILFGFGHSGGGPKHKSKKDQREVERARQWWHRRTGRTATDGPDISGDSFRKYWEAEGKTAYEAYVAARKGERPDRSSE